MDAIEWRGTAPFSRRFDDIYYHPEHGLDESDYVFCEGNNLSGRFSKLGNDSTFTIGELGYGTGLNFFAAVKTFLATAPNDAHLHFVSVEKYPLSADEIAHALSPLDDRTDLKTTLIRSYTDALRVQNTYWQFNWRNIHLTVHFGDALSILQRSYINADAWFLDGFAPQKNPSLWCSEIFERIADTANNLTSFSTFSAAGEVRRNLLAVGFTVNKRPGFGKKRECLYGQINKAAKNRAPWLRNPPNITTQSKIAVIGAGIAGSLCARRLAEYGYHVDLIDRHRRVASETSGQKRLILYPRLTSDWSTLGSFAWLGLAAQYHYIKSYCPEAHDLNGVTLVSYNQNEAQRLRAIADGGVYDPEYLLYLSADELSERTGICMGSGGLDIPHGGSVDVVRYIEALCEHPRINKKLSTPIEQITYKGQWQLTSSNAQMNYDAVILANAHSSIAGLEDYALPISKARGQVSQFKATAASSNLKRVLCHKGYITPSIDGLHMLGATYNPNDTNCDYEAAHDAINLANFTQHLPSIAANFDLSESCPNEAEVAFRAITPDHLPLVGALALNDSVSNLLKPMAKDARKIPDADFAWSNGLYCSLGHGSRGLIGSALAADHIVALMTNTPSPLTTAIHQEIEPQRFLRRTATRSTPRQN